jgi:hypothetical protein
MAGTHVSVSSGRGYAKAPYGSFAGRMPSILNIVPTDLDRGGIPRQWVLARFGPGIGRVRVPLQSRYLVTTVGNTILNPSITVVEVNAPGPVMITLPSAKNPAVIAQERLFAKVPMVISDISGAAATNPITIFPAPGETIMGLSSLVISTNYGGLTLEPSATLQGWNLIAP